MPKRCSTKSCKLCRRRRSGKHRCSTRKTRKYRNRHASGRLVGGGTCKGYTTTGKRCQRKCQGTYCTSHQASHQEKGAVERKRGREEIEKERGEKEEERGAMEIEDEQEETKEQGKKQRKQLRKRKNSPDLEVSERPDALDLGIDVVCDPGDYTKLLWTHRTPIATGIQFVLGVYKNIRGCQDAENAIICGDGRSFVMDWT